MEKSDLNWFDVVVVAVVVILRKICIFFVMKVRIVAALSCSFVWGTR